MKEGRCSSEDTGLSDSFISIMPMLNAVMNPHFSKQNQQEFRVTKTQLIHCTFISNRLKGDGFWKEYVPHHCLMCFSVKNAKIAKESIMTFLFICTLLIK